MCAIGALGSGCQSADSCGPGSASEYGLSATGSSSAGSIDLAYGDFVSSQNNDCNDPNGPTGLISLTVTGMEMGTTGLVTLCIPRPDELETNSVPLGNNTGVEVIDFTGADANCQYAFDPTVAAAGNVSSTGMCNDGGDESGYALQFFGNVALDATCGSAAPVQIQVELTGNVSVTASK